LAVVFVIALAVVVGKQMSAEAMAVVVGVVCGVAAGIPTSLLLLVAFSRRDRLDEPDRLQRQHNYPPVVVIQGGSSQALPPGQQAGYWPAPPPTASTSRQFHVVGGDELFLDDR